jgi:hypothetical protein
MPVDDHDKDTLTRPSVVTELGFFHSGTARVSARCHPSVTHVH